MIGTALALGMHLVLWHAYSGGEQQALETVVQKWNGAQKDRPAALRVQVEAVPLAFSSMADKLQAAVPRGHGPDLFLFAHNIVGEWSRYGLIEPLDGYRAITTTLPSLLPQTVAPLRVDGRLYGLPLSAKTLALFYRKDLVATPPRTTAELLALCQRFRQEGRPPATRRYGLAYDAADFFLHAPWLHGFGGTLYPPGAAEPVLYSEPAVRSVAFIAELARRKDIPDEMSSVLVTQFFNQGRAATVINGPWFIGQIEPGVPYGVALLPVVSETGLPATPLSTVEAGFLNPHGAHKTEAAEFLRYLASPEAALVRALQGRQAVTTEATWQDPRVLGDPILRTFREQLPVLRVTDSRPEMRAVWEPGALALRQVLRGTLGPDKALQLAQRQLDLYLRPLPPQARDQPYLILLGSLLLLGAAWLVRRFERGHVLRRMWRQRGAYGYLGPAALAMGLLVFVPFAVGAGMSLYGVDLDGAWRFIGLSNFADLLLCRQTSCFDRTGFYYTLLVTVLWTALNVILHVLIGGSLALLLRDPLLRLRGVYRMLLLVPWAVPNYITALIWKGMFNRQFGAINGILTFLGLSPVAWFSSFLPALSANVITNVWLGFPFMMVVTLGALAQIPREVEEAAMLDGASRWQTLRHIILPLLGPALLPSIMLGAVWTFNMFNIVFLVSAGEPDGATEILVSQAYRWAFTRGHRYGYAAAYAVLIFVVLLFQSALMRRFSDHGAET